MFIANIIYYVVLCLIHTFTSAREVENIKDRKMQLILLPNPKVSFQEWSGNKKD